MRSVPLPPHLVESAQRYADGTVTPAEPRDASTVVLLRPGATGPEVYLLRRHTTMAFAGGMCVFPGGGVDPRDFDHEVPFAGPSLTEWASALSVSEGEARALVCAAVRETFEESGVLLAGPSADTVVADTTGEDWERDRAALEARELSFTDFVSRRGLVLRGDLLGVWTGYLTPVFEPKRYRTWFFVAEVPPGQATRDVSTESDRVEWLPAMSAVERVEAGDIFMLPPTYLTCLEVAQHSDPESVLVEARERTVEMFMPEVEPATRTLSIPPRLEDLLATRP